MSSSYRSIVDWDDAKRRIAELGAALNRSDTLSAAEAQAILQARAGRLAQVQHRATDKTSIEVMILKLAGEHYALETRVIREVIRTTSLTRLPGTTSHIAGLMNLRGRPLLVIDGRRLLGLAVADLTQSGRVVVLGAAHAEFGLLTEATDEVTSIVEGEICDPPQSLSADARRLVRGVTGRTLVHEPNHMSRTLGQDREQACDPVIVLDSERLMDDPRLWIDDQVE